MIIAIHREKIHRIIYLTGLSLLVCSISLSNFLLSISQFILAINWLLQGNFLEKWYRLRNNSGIFIFASVFLIYVLGFFHSSDTAMAAERIKNALPLLALPLIIGTSDPLSDKSLKNILILFCGSVLVAVIVGFIKFSHDPLSDNYRELSFFMHSLRFALLIDMATIICIYLIFHNRWGRDAFWAKMLYGLGSVLFVVYLMRMKSLTGIGILGVLLMGFTFFSAWKLQNIQARRSIITLLILLVFCIAGFITVFWIRNFTAPPFDATRLEWHTKNHKQYTHDLSKRTLENGHYINLYVCEEEITGEWNRMSAIHIDTNTLSGRKVHETLIRYLTSLGLRKDSVSVHKLTLQDIKNIEKGIPNYRFREKFGILQRIHESLWEIHVYQKTGYVKWHSFGQRIVFAKTGARVFSDSPYLGTGTGDVYNSMVSQLKFMKLEIDPLWRGKPHNQYLFYLIAFGIFGFVWIVAGWVIPVISNKTYRFMLFNMFAIIMALSMLILDALEGYQIMVFFAFFYSLFVFALQKNPSQ